MARIRQHWSREYSRSRSDFHRAPSAAVDSRPGVPSRGAQPPTAPPAPCDPWSWPAAPTVAPVPCRPIGHDERLGPAARLQPDPPINTTGQSTLRCPAQREIDRGKRAQLTGFATVSPWKTDPFGP